MTSFVASNSAEHGRLWLGGHDHGKPWPRLARQATYPCLSRKFSAQTISHPVSTTVRAYSTVTMDTLEEATPSQIAEALVQAQSSAGAHRAENSDTQTQSSVGERSGAELQLEQPHADDSSVFEDAQSNAEQLPPVEFTNLRKEILDPLYAQCQWNDVTHKWMVVNTEFPLALDIDYWKNTRT